jgi:ABC-2 type transport system permease protein
VPGRLSRFAQWLRLWAFYAVQKVKVELSYRADFLFGILASLLYTLLQLFFIWALFSRVPVIAGWTYEEVVMLYGFSQLSFGWFSVGCFELVNKLNDYYIIEGNLDRALLRPASPLMQLIMENISLRELHVVIKGTAIVLWAMSHMSEPIRPGPGAFLAMQALGIMGGFIYMGVFMAVASLGFWIKDRVGLTQPFFSVNEAARYPMTIYHPGAQFLFTAIIPFGYAAFFPAVYFKEPERWIGLLAIGPLIAVGSVTLAVLLFNRGLRYYESSGT